MAIKALRLDVPPEQAAEIAEELTTLALDWPRHPGLAETIAAGLEGETPWLALRHLESPTLDTALREGRRARLEAALEGIVSLAEAIDAAHSQQIVHGSLHPRDVFVDAQGVTRVTGFGIAQILVRFGIRPPVRRPYTAPEALESSALTASADLFSLGVLAFEWLTGRRPAGLGADAAAHFDAGPVDAARVQPIVAAMLAENPSHRPGSATAFARALRQALTGSQDVSLVGEAPPSTPARTPSPEEALRLFATQGTLWGAPSGGEAWRGSEMDAARDRVPEKGDIEVVDLDVVPFELGPFKPESEPARPPDDTLVSTGNDDTVIQSTSILGLSSPEPRRPEPRLEPEPPAPPEPPPPPPAARTIEPMPLDASLTLRDDITRPDFEPRDVPERTIAAPAASDATIIARAPLAEPHAESAPSGVVLVLTLALGLAIGGAGGYLLGQRSAARAREQAAVTSPAVLDEPRLGSDASAPPTPPAETPPVVSDAPPVAPPAVRPRPAVTTGELMVKSMPARAGVVVNNVWRGRTPITVSGLSFGTHTVRVAEKGYEPETRRVSLDARVPAATVSVQLERAAVARRPAPPTVVPGATTGSLFIESRPSGARVLVDGQLVGTTPLLIGELSPGAHGIRLEHPGHRLWTTTVAISAGRRQRVAASLEEGSQ